MTSKFYDLEISKLDDGTIRLEQHYGCDESAIVDLHPAQAAFIADGLPVNAPERIQPQWAMERIATLERRLLWMRDRFDECHAALPSDMHERCAEAPEFSAWLMASVDVATEFCADLSGARADCQQEGNGVCVTKALPEQKPPISTLQPSAAGCGNGHPEQPSGDLFTEPER